jgi:hypothetical protein
VFSLLPTPLEKAVDHRLRVFQSVLAFLLTG